MKLWAESKISALVGKAIAATILAQHAESLIRPENWMALFILLTALIAPDLFKKVVSMRLGSSSDAAPK